MTNSSWRTPLPTSFPSRFSLLAALLLAISLAGCQSVSPTQSVDQSLFVSPQDGSQSVDPFQYFEWHPVSGAEHYYLRVGTSPDAADIYEEGGMPANTIRRYVGGLLPGPTYYARLYYLKDKVWSYAQISFRTVTPEMPDSHDSFLATIQAATAAVRMSTAGETNLPQPGTALATETEFMGLQYATCETYSNTLTALLASSQVISRRVTLVFVGYLTHMVVEYYDPFIQRWAVTDPTFGLMYFDDATQTGQSAEELNQYLLSESFTQIHPKLLTAYGNDIAKAYPLDPVTLFLNILPTGELEQDAVMNSPLQYLFPASEGTQGEIIFQFPSSSGSITIDDPPGSFGGEASPVQLTPLNSTAWTRNARLNDGWSIVAGPPGVQAYSFRRIFY